MASWRDKTFKPVRRRALKRWLAETGRLRLSRHDDDFSGAIECSWQNRAEAAGRQHVALFCGIGDWASHITDLLLDTSCDNLRFDKEAQQRRLSRNYSRLMFVIAELLNDFEDTLDKAGIHNGRDALSGVLSVSDFQAFVNQVVKHKAKAIHRHDHHLPLRFMDAGADGGGTQVIRLGTKDFTGHNGFDAILIPSLDQLLDMAFGAYQAFDGLVEEQSVFEKICTEYEGPCNPVEVAGGV